MARVLIAYGTTDGQTAKIAQHIADAGRELGHVVNTLVLDLTNPRSKRLVWRSTAAAKAGRLRPGRIDAEHAAEIAQVRSPDDYAGVILGASLYKGRYPRDIAALVKLKSAWLNAHPSAFFSVSLGTVGRDPYEIADAERDMDDFLEQNGWQPDRTASFSGLRFAQPSWLERVLMKYTSWREDDVSSGYEYTDWSSVTTFAKRFFADVARSTENSVPRLPAGERGGVPDRSRPDLRA